MRAGFVAAELDVRPSESLGCLLGGAHEKMHRGSWVNGTDTNPPTEHRELITLRVRGVIVLLRDSAVVEHDGFSVPALEGGETGVTDD